MLQGGTRIRIRYHARALVTEALIRASSYLDRRAERIACGLALDDQWLQVSKEDWGSIYTERWPEPEEERIPEGRPPF